MTKQEAIEGLEMYEQMCCFEPKSYWSKYDFTYKSYSKSIIPFIIKRILDSENHDPLVIIRLMKMDLDDLIGESENSRTWAFCSIMCKILDDIILWLK